MELRLANQVFGGGASSRLFLNLRERNGYTYGAYSSLRTYREAGVFLAAADVNADKTTLALREAIYELEKMCQSQPSEEEMRRSRAEITGTFVRQMETAASIAELELQRRMNQLPEDYYSTFLPRLNAVSAEQALAASRRFFDPGKLLIVVVGDRVRVERELDAFGEVKVFDDQGRRLER